MTERVRCWMTQQPHEVINGKCSECGHSIEKLHRLIPNDACARFVPCRDPNTYGKYDHGHACDLHRGHTGSCTVFEAMRECRDAEAVALALSLDA